MQQHSQQHCSKEKASHHPRNPSKTTRINPLLSFSPWWSAVSARCPSHAPKGVRRGATDMRELGGTWRWKQNKIIASNLIWIVLKCHLEWFTFSDAFARQRSSKSSMFHLAKGIKWFSFSWHGSARIFTVSLGGLEIGAEIQVSSLTFERGHNGRMMLDTLCSGPLMMTFFQDFCNQQNYLWHPPIVVWVQMMSTLTTVCFAKKYAKLCSKKKFSYSWETSNLQRYWRSLRLTMTYLPFFQLLNLYQSQDPPVHLWDQSTFFGATTSSFPKIAWKLDDTAPSTSRSVENGGEGFASKKNL